MKKFLVIVMAVVLLQGCASSKPAPAEQTKPEAPAPATQPQTSDSSTPDTTAKPAEPAAPTTDQPPESPASFANEKFRNVTVKKTKDGAYEVKGSAQTFEAVVNYVVEDGHNELTKGSFQTSAGAPEWGDFSHTLQVKKADPNTTLTLVLFESSPKDGSRVSELPVPLPE